jgi:hypothetical protein
MQQAAKALQTENRLMASLWSAVVRVIQRAAAPLALHRREARSAVAGAQANED